jgi:RHS repeat-associated protein
LQSATETGSWSQTYDYDRFGNRWVSLSSGYTVDVNLCPTQQSHIDAATNRINKLTMPGFDYDTSGNQTAQIRGGQSETLAYDSENRMTSFVSGSSTTSYVYDGDGRRVKKTVGGVTTVFVYNASSQLIAEYATEQPQGEGGTRYLTSDHLGSTRLVTDSSGNVKARYDYLPFGEELNAGVGGRTTAMGYDAADSTRQRFTSKERDTESGLDYFGARYYGSVQGRFTSTDPIFF